MTSTSKGVVLLLCGIGLLLQATVGAGTLTAGEPMLLVYPDEPTIFRYDTSRYEVVSASHPGFDAGYAISGQMLWDKLEQRVPHEVYRAPQLQGFEISPYGMNEFFLIKNEFKVIVDGFCESPRTFNNLHMRFIPFPSHSNVQVRLGADLLETLVTPIASLTVTTPVADGFYSDTRQHHLLWSGAIGVRITVYSDKDNDMVYSGGKPPFSIYVEDNTVATEETSWGAIKALYRDR